MPDYGTRETVRAGKKVPLATRAIKTWVNIDARVRKNNGALLAEVSRLEGAARRIN